MKPNAGSQGGACLNGATQLYLVSEDLLRRFAAEVSRAVLAEMGSLLPPFSKYALPPNTRKAQFCAAIAAGAVRSSVRGRVHYVSRPDWDAYTMNRSIPAANGTMPDSGESTGPSESITVLAHPTPANDKPEQTPMSGALQNSGKPTARELLEQARSQTTARRKEKGR